MGKPRRGISLHFLVRFFLRPVVPSHLSLRPKNRSPCVTIAFPPVQDRGEPLLFCFPKRQKPFLLSDGERARSSNQGRTPAFRRLCLDFSKAVSHIINTPKDNS